MLPMELCWSLTLHKMQSYTVEYAKVYCNPKRFAAEQAYIVLSWIKFQTNFLLETWGKIPCNKSHFSSLSIKNSFALNQRILHPFTSITFHQEPMNKCTDKCFAHNIIIFLGKINPPKIGNDFSKLIITSMVPNISQLLIFEKTQNSRFKTEFLRFMFT